jgi:hypothetical protein
MRRSPDRWCGRREELRRQEQPALRVVPPQQRFGREDPLLLQVQLGLVVREELVTRQGLAEVGLQAEAVADRLTQVPEKPWTCPRPRRFASYSAVSASRII